MLLKLTTEYPRSPIVVVFDAPGKTFRDDIYTDYKANRDAMPDDLRLQIKPVHEGVDLLGMTKLVIQGVEADDVIGTLATRITASGGKTVISTSDKDLSQLVNDDVTIINTMTQEQLDVNGVKAKFGVGPELIVDYLTLVGDKVDNIPGVPKCGPKTAVKWLTDYGSLDGVIDQASEVKGKVGENLRDSVVYLPRSKDLATIRCDVELDLDLSELHKPEVNREEIGEFFTRFDLRSLYELVLGADESTPEREFVTEIVETLPRLESVVDAAIEDGVVGLGMLGQFRAGKTPLVVAATLCSESVTPCLIPLLKESLLDDTPVPESSRFSILARLLTHPNVRKVCHNVKSVRHLCSTFGVDIAGAVDDVMLFSYVLESNSPAGHHVRGMASAFLKRNLQDERDLYGRGKNRKTPTEFSKEDMAAFGGDHVQAIFDLHSVLQTKLAKEPMLRQIYHDIEIPLERTLFKMEHAGVLLNTAVLTELDEELEKQSQSLEQEAFTLVGREFNLNSPKQLQVILFDELGLPAPKANARGNRSTSENVLEDLAQRESHRLPSLILEYRATTKLRSTYIFNLLLDRNQDTGRIHTTYEQANAITGRLASNNPNLQNIPIRTPVGRRIREAFVAPESYRLVAADYSQIELRVMAHISKDPGLKSAFERRLDIHTATAAEVFELDLETVSDEDRRRAKAINFGLMYGMSPFGLARNLSIDRATAQRYIEMYFDRYPSVRRYMEETKRLARELGYVSTILGRRIYIRDINARSFVQRQAAERLAINAPVQGSAADIIKKATVACDEWLAQADVDALMLLQVHDELVFEVHEEQIDKLEQGVEQVMHEAASLDVDVMIEFGNGTNWSAAH